MENLVCNLATIEFGLWFGSSLLNYWKVFYYSPKLSNITVASPFPEYSAVRQVTVGRTRGRICSRRIRNAVQVLTFWRRNYYFFYFSALCIYS